jgi:hypothetical protein
MNLGEASILRFLRGQILGIKQSFKEEMLPIANERGNHPNDPNKRDP